ncbi:TM0106 family RecB-like putative nuclease [Cumulibacter soli]|uniref:TM0106 family RecB-like putative nuclease n=1 Tax=Cumulibacter soli TaxID=2546344 RepID=UPI001067DE04|nr:bifunctional RecB family nuclease/DEAD/DEAH box helicase [Cumulibacter soli]
MALLSGDGSFVLSPSDLTASASCEFGWLREIDGKLGRASKLDVVDPLMSRIARLGDQHEARVLERMRGDRAVVSIDRPAPYSPEGLQRAADATHRALRDGAEVVAQAVLYDGTFGGMADFLVRNDAGRYEVWDAKLARRERVSALLQIAAYADQLDRMGVPRSSEGYLVLGDHTRHGRDLDDIIPVYRRRRSHLTDMLRAHLTQPLAVEWGDARYAICGACAYCEAEIAASDDLLLVAGLTRLQRERLRAANIGTMSELAASTQPVGDLTERTWRTLRDQASMQANPGDTVTYEFFEPAMLDLLPAPDDGDIFFDFEGDPLWTDSDGIAAGLEYLFGLITHDQPTGEFTAFWAHDRAQERQALIDFFDYVAKRRERHPGLHIYHYAPYEPTALKRLTTRHSYGEDQLDDLLRDGVFVDLYSVVRRSLRVSQPSYSIKKLEPLYMGDRLRAEDGVTNAADSVVQYHEFTDARTRGDDAEAARLLEEIADYNEYDCLSTWNLRDWLYAHRARTEVAPHVVEADGREPGKLAELQAVADGLLALIPPDRADRNPEQQGMALLAAALGYFRREDKPMWWAYFDRGISPVDEWADQRNTLVVAKAEVLEEWATPTPRARTLARTLRLSGTIDAGTTLCVGSKVRSVYEDLPPHASLDPGAHRWIADKDATVTAIEIDLDGSATVCIEEKTKQGQDAFDELPMAIFEYTFISTDTLEASIQSLAGETASIGRLPEGAAYDILARRAPRLYEAGFDARLAGESVSVEALTAAVRSLDRSYLAVQGPPGAGKTYLGSRVVADLARAGWKIGVVAQGHATVEQFLNKVVAEGLPADLVAKKPKDSGAMNSWTALKDTKDIPDFLAGDGGVVVGGTAWTFAGLADGCLDLLVIDEAGQFSLAHTLAAARPAQRLLLLGDPQQLPQVSQGSHPEPVDSSALGWLAEGHDTLPAERGYFLARTWRMHADLTAPVSTLAYDGRLTSNTHVTGGRDLAGVTAGLHSVPVQHADNSVLSVEEADAVVALIDELVGSSWTPKAGDPARALSASDVIVVAPFNAQVAAIRRALDAAGHGATEVGTVDRFQGREAAVSIVSLAASSAADIPRGLEFLLDRRRLNVAISRAQWASYVVHSPALGDTLPTNVDALVQLGSFLRLLAAY